MNNIFDKLVKSKIEKFISDYKTLSREIFVNKKGQPFHPSEFGIYREKIVKSLIEPFLPARLAVGSGFIITNKGHISTQCDLIIYDKINTPNIENNDEQRFFPVECVVGVIEVKSKLNKTSLKKALQKLAKIKDLRNDIDINTSYVYKKYNDKTPLFDTRGSVFNQMATFLICESVDMNFSQDIKTFFKDTYNGIDASLFHNLILSVYDGLFMYYSEKDKLSIYYPYLNYNDNFSNEFIEPKQITYDKEHILTFVNFLSAAISNVSILNVDMTRYLGEFRLKNFIIDK